LARFGIDELKLKRITLIIAVPNKASQRVAEKAGAVREGVQRNGMFVREIMYDTVMFSIIPQDLGRRV
jgi:RimJ/RimL family protein N-acetyltransferase